MEILFENNRLFYVLKVDSLNLKEFGILGQIKLILRDLKLFFERKSSKKKNRFEM